MRTRMPDGVAPEDIPGGKSREREMRSLERRLEEIGPTNALADAECRELEERYTNLQQQLEDITGARADLETLIAKLREEEETRYEAVFGAVAMNFQEYFSQLAPGGRATLRHAEGEDGPRTGVEILVQPPRKRQPHPVGSTGCGVESAGAREACWLQGSARSGRLLAVSTTKGWMSSCWALT